MEALQFIVILLIAMVKPLLTPPLAYAGGMPFWLAVISISCGGILGFLFFYGFTDFIVKRRVQRRPDKRNFRLAHKIVGLKYRYKLGVFLLIMPFFSAPIMGSVVRKIFGHSKKSFLISLGSILFWCVFSCLVFSPIQRV